MKITTLVPRIVIARRERKRATRQSIVSRGSGRVCLFAYWFTVDRHGLRPRDDKIGKEWECAVRLQHDLCHCEERAERDDAAIHRVSREANGFVYSLTGSQWIATGLRPRDDKIRSYESPVEETFEVLHSTHLLHRLIPQWGFAKPNHILTTRDQDAFPSLAL